MYKGANYIYDCSIFYIIVNLSEIRIKIHKIIPIGHANFILRIKNKNQINQASIRRTNHE